MSGDVGHPFHLVNPSKWPLIGATSTFVLAFGGIKYMHDAEATGLLLLGFLMVIGTMVGWWREVITESVTHKAHTPAVRSGLRQGMALFICSEVMFFVAFFWAYFNAAFLVSPTVEVWPPEGIKTFDPFHLPFFNTLLLLGSGLTCNWAHHSIVHGNRDEFIKALAITVVLGVAFTVCQAIEYSHAAFGLTEGVYPTVFYLATGFHGLHVIIGTIFLAVCLGRAMKGHFTPEAHVGFESAAWYWHFVDVVWLFLFVWVYWWGA